MFWSIVIKYNESNLVTRRKTTNSVTALDYSKLLAKQYRLNTEIDKFDDEIDNCAPDDANNLLRKRDRKVNDLNVVTALISQHLMSKKYASSS